MLHCCSGRSAASRVWWDYAQPALLPVLLDLLVGYNVCIWLQRKGRRGCDQTRQDLAFSQCYQYDWWELQDSFPVKFYVSGRRKLKHSKASEQQKGACLQAGTKLTLLKRIWEASAAYLSCLVQNKCFLWSKSKAEHTDLGCTSQISTMSQLPPHASAASLCWMNSSLCSHMIVEWGKNCVGWDKISFLSDFLKNQMSRRCNEQQVEGSRFSSSLQFD